MTKQLMDIFDRMMARYGDPKWWPAKSPYEVIVGAVLTQNTNWSNVEKAIANFGGKLSPDFVLSLEHSELADIIHPAGFFNQKAGYLQTVTRWFGKYDFNVDVVSSLPMDRIRTELLMLKGIGPETADSILLYAFGFPSFVIDAYTLRLSERLPLPIGSRKYDDVKVFFERYLPRDTRLFNVYHALIVFNAKAHCKIKPSCNNCPLFDVCSYSTNWNTQCSS
jgi:endonuclease-3 related protein